MQTIRPSSLARIIKCPGSFALCADYPAYLDDEGDNTVRDEGTAAHWVADQIAKGTAPAIGGIAPNGVKTDKAMFDGARMYLDAVAGVELHHRVFEHSMQIPDVHAQCSGTCDTGGVLQGSDPMIFVGDFKYGFGTVEVWPNPQLAAYAVGLARAYGFDPYAVHYTLLIAQPRGWHRSGPLRFARLEGYEMAAYMLDISRAVAQATQPNAPLVPDPKTCRYCPGRTQCSVSMAEAIAPTPYVPPEEIATALAETLLKEFLRREAFIKAAITGLKAQLSHAVKTGQRLQHFEVSRKAGRLEWKPENMPQILAAARLMGIELEKPTEYITPTQALAAKMPAASIQMHTQRTDGALELIPSDPSKWVEIFNRS